MAERALVRGISGLGLASGPVGSASASSGGPPGRASASSSSGGPQGRGSVAQRWLDGVAADMEVDDDGQDDDGRSESSEGAERRRRRVPAAPLLCAFAEASAFASFTGTILALRPVGPLATH